MPFFPHIHNPHICSWTGFVTLFLYVLSTIVLLQYLQAAYPSAALLSPFDFSLSGISTQAKAFRLLAIGGLVLSIAWLVDMTDMPVQISDLDNDDAHKKLYIEKRNGFRNNPIYMEELKQWKAGNNDYEYPNLKQGFIPRSLQGVTVGEGPYAKSDTFFSDYKTHSEKLILSESAESYILVNRESYDRRQYPEWLSADYQPGKNTAEGQAFAHTLVIPKERILNIVDPDATRDNGAMLKELQKHFVYFWEHGGADKILARVKDVVESRNDTLAANQDTLDQFNRLLPKVRETFTEMSDAFKNLKPDDFVYGFHPFPDASVGHLHMHVFPKDKAFRTVSTTRHDWKTIPLKVILEAEEEIASKENITRAS